MSRAAEPQSSYAITSKVIDVIAKSAGPCSQHHVACMRSAAGPVPAGVFDKPVFHLLQGKLEGEDATGQQPYKLPAPPSPYRNKLG